jgi:hypothetical protein
MAAISFLRRGVPRYAAPSLSGALCVVAWAGLSLIMPGSRVRVPPLLLGFYFLGLRHALCWHLATSGAVKYTPQGETLGNVLELMLSPGGHEQEVA